MIEAVLFDLDDTLFDQHAWLEQAWRAVARAASPWGVAAEALTAALIDVAAEGSANGRIIDRSLERIGAAHVPLEPLLVAFRRFECPPLRTYPGVAAGLARLRRRVPLALVTDGDVETQASKLKATGLEASFDAIVFSDELGRERRKPHRAPFEAALGRLGAAAGSAVHVGDNPAKDVAGATAVGIRAIRVLSGEYRRCLDAVPPWARVRDVGCALDLIHACLDGLEPDDDRYVRID